MDYHEIFMKGELYLEIMTGELIPTSPSYEGRIVYHDITNDVIVYHNNTTWVYIADNSMNIDAETLDGQDSTDFAISTHNHDVDYADISHNHNTDYLLAANNLSDVPNKQTALTNLGLTINTTDPTGGVNGNVWIKI